MEADTTSSSSSSSSSFSFSSSSFPSSSSSSSSFKRIFQFLKSLGNKLINKNIQDIIFCRLICDRGGKMEHDSSLWDRSCSTGSPPPTPPPSPPPPPPPPPLNTPSPPPQLHFS
ncbi:hypothetical protein E2C01_040238 [Portunus trituberculatus]|uniref:Uncharacterized protein n=1 Tax=Portunus trituberculatus TaxID=210409 RepID=A0A5B7FNM7_PORTR|nr:hypothetical protein [Portunus trituberculatus]